MKVSLQRVVHFFGILSGLVQAGRIFHNWNTQSSYQVINQVIVSNTQILGDKNWYLFSIITLCQSEMFLKMLYTNKICYTLPVIWIVLTTKCILYNTKHNCHKFKDNDGRMLPLKYYLLRYCSLWAMGKIISQK